VYGMPLDVHAGLHEFLVAAENSRNKVTATPLEVGLFASYVIHTSYTCLFLLLNDVRVLLTVRAAF